MIKYIKNVIKYKGTKISPLSTLTDVSVGENVGIRPLVKM